MFPIIPANTATASFPENDEGIFGFGWISGNTGVTNLVSNVGVVASDTAGVGLARRALSACEYGGDKGIVGFGIIGYGAGQYATGITNLVSNAGVVASDVAAVGTARHGPAACGYGGDKGIFAYGNIAAATDISNLVSNTGVVGADVAGVGTARYYMGACEYGGDKGIFGYGRNNGSDVSITNLVSNAGVVSSDVAGVGTARNGPAACSFN